MKLKFYFFIYALCLCTAVSWGQGQGQMAIGPLSFTISHDAGAKTLTIGNHTASVLNWTVTSNASWIKIPVSESSGKLLVGDNVGINFTVDANTSSSLRTGTITVIGGDGIGTPSTQTSTVYQMHAITLIPQSASVTAGGTVTFMCPQNLALDFVSYRWQVSSNGGSTWNNVSGSNYAGQSTATLTISNIPVAFNGNLYRCIASTLRDAVIEHSIPAPLTVTAPLPSIISHPNHKNIVEGEGASFSVAATDCSGTFSYQWQYRTGDFAAWNNVVNGGVYSGATTPTLTLSSGLTTAYNGYQFRAIVLCSSMPDYPLYSDAGFLSVTAPPVIIRHPDHSNIMEGSGTSFSVVAINCSGWFSFQWQYRANANSAWNNVPNSGLYSGAMTHTLTLSSGVTAAYNGFQYRCRVICSAIPYYSVYSDIGTLTVTSEVAVIQLVPPAEPFCTIQDNISIAFRKLENTHPIRYRISFADAAKAAGFKDQTSFENLPANLLFNIPIPQGVSTGSYAGVVHVECPGVVNLKVTYPFTFTVVNNGVAIVNHPPAYQSICSGASIALAVDIAGRANSYQWYRNGQAITGAGNREYVAATAGNYHVEIMGECGTIRSTVAVVSDPASDPAAINARVKWGSTLYVENASDTYQRYQWYHNGTAIHGATFVYLFEKDGFLGEYYARCYKADGTFDDTCPVIFDVRTRSGAANVYPNVVKTGGVLNISITDAGFVSEATVEIYSLFGIKVYSTKVTTPAATIRPDFRHKGNYFVLIKLPSGEVYSEKIIVQ